MPLDSEAERGTSLAVPHSVPPSTKLDGCAGRFAPMLFVATSINYMDRQVIAILEAHARTQHRHDGGKLRLHCGRVPDCLRDRACWLPGG